MPQVSQDKQNKKPTLYEEYWHFFRDFFRDLFDDRLGFYAASMSWSTLFFIIPFLVILLVLFTYMPMFGSAYAKFHTLISQMMPSDSTMIFSYVDKFVENAGKLGILGIGYVIIAAALFFKDYDFIVNDIFETPQRGMLSAIKTYFFMILLLPMTLGGFFWISGYISSHLGKLDSLFHIYLVVPFLILWILFFTAYQLSPRMKISPKAAALSSFISSLVWYGAKTLFFYYILYNKTYTSIYGGLSSLLFFLLWIYISWAIFLHGLRFCYILNKDQFQAYLLDRSST